LAGPDLFLPDADRIGRLKRDICKRHGLEGLFPLDSNPPDDGAPLSQRIFRANTALMDKADAIIANLTPFRGASADVGTVYELGYMAGCGKLLFAYSNDPAAYSERVTRTQKLTTSSSGQLIDRDGLIVEDFGLPDNLMMIN